MRRGPHRLLRLYLDRAREMLGRAIIVESGNRCAAHNADVGGEDKSEHGYPEGCLGADLDANTSREKWQLVDALRQAGFTRIGLYHNRGSVHAGVGDAVDPETWPANVLWVR
jgi:uncharacterized protein YcbK (DUF882 family)